MFHHMRVGNDSYPLGPVVGVGLFFFADEWSVGPFARLLYAFYSDVEAAGGLADYSYVLPSIGAAITLH